MSKDELRLQVQSLLSDLPDINFWSRDEKENLPRTTEHFSLILEKILSRISIGENTKILDAGCGESHFSIIIKKMFNSDLTALDLFDKPKKRLDFYNIPFLCHDFCKHPFPFPEKSFDIVLLMDVIEHLTSGQHALLRDVKRILKPGGILIIGTPNLLSFPKRIKFLLGYSPLTPFQETELQDHIHEYSQKELNNILESIGLTIIESNVLNLLYKFLGRNALVKYIYKLTTLISGSFGDYILVIAKNEP